MKKFLTITANSILIIFVIVGILLVLSMLPIKNNFKIFNVMSGSMEPSISVGSLIIVKPQSEYKPGDVITFKSTQKKNDFTTHRIKEVRDSSGSKVFITKGDANEESDMETVALGRVVGKELFSIAIIGYILWFVRTLPGLIVVIIIPSLAIIYIEMDKIKNELAQIKNAKKKAIIKRSPRVKSPPTGSLQKKKSNSKNKKNVTKKGGRNADKKTK